jgi:hypothetical protein
MPDPRQNKFNSFSVKYIVLAESRKQAKKLICATWPIASVGASFFFTEIPNKKLGTYIVNFESRLK